MPTVGPKVRGGITPACAGNRSAGGTNPVQVVDHPRLCGEQANISARAAGEIGSPPLVRGTAHNIVLYNVENGITPACAGNSSTPQSYGHCRRDHPRLCGEQPGEGPGDTPRGGSPPLVRGTDFCGPCSGGGCRITPACAGNRRERFRFCLEIRDHPRLCGEQSLFFTVWDNTLGSPPLVRGTELRTATT